MIPKFPYGLGTLELGVVLPGLVEGVVALPGTVEDGIVVLAGTDEGCVVAPGMVVVGTLLFGTVDGCVVLPGIAEGRLVPGTVVPVRGTLLDGVTVLVGLVSIGWVVRSGTVPGGMLDG
ncbi:MAG: hypothetical protein ABIN80_28995 [Dyadobacter sp.]|uniref:hypothetical protein n=1 Tax=Dyadobacter sp. TaxID=1914288 RepID=UPI0032677B2F